MADTPSTDFTQRYRAAETFRNDVKAKIREVQVFCRPGTEKAWDRQIGQTDSDEVDTYTSLPEELASDFAGDLVNYFTPPEAKWYSYLVTAEIPEDFVEQVTALVEDREEKLGELIEGSNWNDVAPQVMFGAVHGTPAMWVAPGNVTRPIHIEAVPAHELLLAPGHHGYLDRFREKWVYSHTVRPLFAAEEARGMVAYPASLKTVLEKPMIPVKVCWGFWLDWTDPNNPLWKSQITVNGKCITPTVLTLGPLAGSCPLLVGRFNPDPDQPWGRGPGRVALPDMRVLDKVDETVLTGLDQNILNTIIYPSDGTLDLSEGIEAGRAYPAGRGFSRDQIWEMPRNVNTDQGWFTQERLEDRIRAIFFQNGPRQRGETPPTAAQWVDERRQLQKRLGKPSAPLWTELIYPFIQRVETLGVAMGKMPEAITHRSTEITVVPISPLQKATNQDKVMVAQANLTLAGQLFADQTLAVIDPIKTFKNVVTASGDELTVVRDEMVQNDPAAAPQ